MLKKILSRYIRGMRYQEFWFKVPTMAVWFLCLSALAIKDVNLYIRYASGGGVFFTNMVLTTGDV